MGEWSKLKYERQVDKMRIKQEATRNDGRVQRRDAVAARIAGGLSGPEEADEVVRSFSEGAVGVYSPNRANRRAVRKALKGDLAQVVSDLGDATPAMIPAVHQRKAHIDIKTRWNDKGRRFVVGTSGSAAGVVVVSLLVLALESVQLNPAAEGFVRTLVPSVGNVTPLAVLIIAALVFLGLRAVVEAARTLKEYWAHRVLADIDAEVGGGIVPPASPTKAWLTTLVALAAQMLLLVMRLRVDTGDSSSRSMFVLLSLSTGVLALLVGYLEFKRTLVDTDSLLSYDQEAIDRYRTLHRQAYDTIPRELAQLDVEDQGEIIDELSLLQDIATDLNEPLLRAAVHRRLDVCNARLAEFEQAVPDYEPPDFEEIVRRASGEPAAVPSAGSRRNGSVVPVKLSVS